MASGIHMEKPLLGTSLAQGRVIQILLEIRCLAEKHPDQAIKQWAQIGKPLYNCLVEICSSLDAYKDGKYTQLTTSKKVNRVIGLLAEFNINDQYPPLLEQLRNLIIEFLEAIAKRQGKLHRFTKDAAQIMASGADALKSEIYRPPHKDVEPTELPINVKEIAQLLATGSGARKIEPPGKPSASTKPGSVLWQDSGAWKAPKTREDPEPQAKTFTFDVAFGGKAKVSVNGEPPAPLQWSLGNDNTSVYLSYAMRLGSEYARASEIARLSGSTTNNKLKQEAEWDGPGRFWVTIGPAQGSGPLSGGFFDQSWDAKVELLSVNPSKPALMKEWFASGDKLCTGAAPAVLLLLNLYRLIVEPHATLVFGHRRNMAVVHLETGTMRLQGLQASSKKQAGSVIIEDHLGNSIQAIGTDFIVRQEKDTSMVCVVEGQVSIGGATKKKIEVGAGQQCEMPSGKLSSFQHDSTKDSAIGGIRTTDIMIDNQPTKPAEVGLSFANGKFGDGWVWEAPSNNVTVASSKRGILTITVPDGNEFWVNQSTAPRLLHKVTGDFDLSGELSLTSKATDNAITEFILYAPGEYLGFHAKWAVGGFSWQMDLNGPGTQYRILGGGWLKMQGCNKLVSHSTPFKEGPDAPKAPIKLLLTRREDLWRTYWSLDGKQWNLSTRQLLKSPDTLWIGWLFKRRAHDGMVTEPAINTLGGVKLLMAPRGSLPPPAWDLIQWCGSVQAQKKTGRLSVAGSRTGWVRATVGQRIEGDFELVVRLTTPPWTHQPGESRGFYIFADADDDANYAYIRLTQRDDAKLGFDTDLRKDGRYGRYRWVATKDYHGTLRLLRRGTAISTYYKVGDKWERLDQFDVGFQLPVFLGIDLDTTSRATKAVSLSGEFKIEKLVGEVIR